MKKQRKGITLIALVITIIVLIILAGITINLVVGENGIVTKAQKAGKDYKQAEQEESLNLEQMDLAAKLQRPITIDDYIQHLVDKGIIFAEEVEKLEDGSVQIKLEDGSVYLVEEKDGEIILTYQGKEGNLLPRIATVEVIGITSNAITIKVDGKRVEEYEYSIKETDKYEKETTSASSEHTFEGLKQGVSYEIRVIAKNKNGETPKIITGIVTGSVADLTSSNTTFAYSKEGWTNEDVTVTASTTVVGYRIQTSKDGINWEDTTSQTFEENGIAYARLVDSTGQEGGSTSANVDNIDKAKPVIETATANTNTITLEATEEGSGIIGYAVTTNETQPTTFTACENTTQLNTSIGSRTQNTQYYVWAKDEAGNVSVAKAVKTISVPTLTSSNTTITPSKTTWTNQNVTTTASTSVTGYTLQTSKDGNNWTNTTTQTFAANGTSYARLIDSTGQAGGRTYKAISNIDKTPPTATASASYRTDANIIWVVNPSDAGGSGVNYGACKLEYTEGYWLIGTNPASYSRYIQMSWWNELGLFAPNKGVNYTIHVLLEDNAGNRTEFTHSYTPR